MNEEFAMLVKRVEELEIENNDLKTQCSDMYDAIVDLASRVEAISYE